MEEPVLSVRRLKHDRSTVVPEGRCVAWLKRSKSFNNVTDQKGISFIHLFFAIIIVKTSFLAEPNLRWNWITLIDIESNWKSNWVATLLIWIESIQQISSDTQP